MKLSKPRAELSGSAVVVGPDVRACMKPFGAAVAFFAFVLAAELIAGISGSEGGGLLSGPGWLSFPADLAMVVGLVALVRSLWWFFGRSKVRYAVDQGEFMVLIGSRVWRSWPCSEIGPFNFERIPVFYDLGPVYFPEARFVVYSPRKEIIAAELLMLDQSRIWEAQEKLRAAIKSERGW